MMGWRGLERTPVDRRCSCWETAPLTKADWRGARGATPDAATRMFWARGLDRNSALAERIMRMFAADDG